MLAGLGELDLAAHAQALLCDASLESHIDVRVIQVLLGHAKLDTTARYTQVATNILRTVMSPLDRLTLPRRTRRQAGRLSRSSSDGPPISGGRGYLPRPRGRMAPSQSRPCEPWPAQGHESPSRTAARRRSAAMSSACENGACGHTAISYNSCIEPPLPEVPGRGGTRMACRPRGRAACRCSTSTRSSPCPRQSRISPTRTRPSIYDLLFKASAETMLTIGADPKHLGARIGFIAVLHTWGSAMTHHPHVHMIAPGGGLSPDGSALDCLPARLLPAGAGALQAVPPAHA